MTNLDKHEWDFSAGEQYAINWLEEHDFEVTLNKRFVSVDRFTVSKNGVTDEFRLPVGNPDIDYRSLMEQFGKNFELLKELTALRKQIKDGNPS